MKSGSKLYSNLKKLFGRVGKRKRFIISALLLGFFVIIPTFFSFSDARFIIPLILILVYLLTFFSILEGLTNHEWITLFIHPVYFTLVISLFYFFLPQRWLTRLPFVVIYTVSIYAIMLSQNIFNVGVFKSLQLFRAAFSINFLFLTLSSYLAYSLILTFRLSFIENGLWLSLATFPLALQFLWSVSPKDMIERRQVKYSALISLIIGELSIFFSFMPFDSAIYALTLTGIFYGLSGLFYAYLQEMFFRERVREYIFVIVFVCLLALFSLNW